MKKLFFFYFSIIFIFISFAIQLYFNDDIQVYFFTITFSSFFYLLSIILLKDIKISIRQILFIIAAIFIFKLTFLQILPIGSDDYFRYLWDGKVIANEINPFKYSPNSIDLNHLRSNLLPDAVTFGHLKTIYFPLSQTAFFIAYYIGGESILGLKIVLLITDVLLTFGLFLLLIKYKSDFKYVLIYTLSPLIFYQFFIDAHIDLIGILFIVFMFYFYEDKKVISAIFLGASLAVKPTFLFAIPILFFSEKFIKHKILWVVIPLVFLAVSFIPFAIDANPFTSLVNFTKHWVFNGAVFNFISMFIDVNQTIRIILLIIFSIYFSLILIFNKSIVSSIYYALLGLLLLSPVVHPWYAAWIIIPLVLCSKLSGITFLSTISLTFYTVLVYQSTGVWQEYSLILIIEYIPVILFIFYEFLKSQFFKKCFTYPKIFLK